MVGSSLPELKQGKGKHGKAMRPLNSQWCNDGKNVRNDVLNGMSVLGRKTDWRCVLVVHFMDAAIETWMVHGAVDVVKRDLAGNHAKSEVGG